MQLMSGERPSEPLALEITSARERGAGPLIEADAVDIWIARWLRIRLRDLVARYGCDSRRLYEIWWGERFPASRAKAEAVFRERYPALVDRTDFGYRRVPRCPAEPGADQLDLFGGQGSA